MYNVVHNLFPGVHFALYFFKLKFTLILGVHFTKSGLCFVHQISLKNWLGRIKTIKLFENVVVKTKFYNLTKFSSFVICFKIIMIVKSTSKIILKSSLLLINWLSSLIWRVLHLPVNIVLVDNLMWMRLQYVEYGKVVMWSICYFSNKRIFKGSCFSLIF